jgi:flagellar biosynthesis protein FlhG
MMRTLIQSDQASGLRQAAVPGRTIAVTSGKGGVGKTSLAVNLALVLARAGHRTWLVDGDLGLANVDVLLNLHPRRSLREVVEGGHALEEVVVEGPVGLKVIPAASGLTGLASLGPVARRALAAKVRALGLGGGLTILDTGAGISPTVLDLVLAADQAVILTTPDPTALTDAYAMVKVLTQRRPGLSLHLVVNLVEQAAQAREIHAHLSRIIRRFLEREVPLAGWIPRDACMERAVREQRPLALYFPYARATDAIQALARSLAPCGATTDEGGFWDRLLESPTEGA